MCSHRLTDAQVVSFFPTRRLRTDDVHPRHRLRDSLGEVKVVLGSVGRSLKSSSRQLPQIGTENGTVVPALV